MRVTKYFADQEKAEEYLDTLNEDLHINGIAGAHMDQIARGDYSAARLYLDAHGFLHMTLLELAKTFVDANGKAAKYSALEALEEFLNTQRADGRAEHTVSNLSIRCKAWVHRMGISWVSQITRDTVKQGTTRTDVGIATRRNDMAALSSWCSWLMHEGYLQHNPVKELRKPRAERKRPHVWTVSQTRAVLEAATSYKAGAFRKPIGMLLLAGLRPSELKESMLIPGKKPAVRVEGGKTKGRANRLVPISQGAFDYIQAGTSEALARGTREDIVHLANERLKQQGQAALQWKHDTPRHTWISHRYRLLDDAKKTASQAGNSEDIIFRYYYRLVTDSDAKAYGQLP
jgi:site-specific recombinase XerC